MADPLITRAQLEAKIGAATLSRLTDHNGDGVADKSTLDRVCEDATSKVRGALGPWYETVTTTAANADTATELRRIALNVALGILACDFPGRTPWDWVAIMAQADQDLKMIRNGRANLGTDGPPPQRSQRARVQTRWPRGWNEDC